MSFNWESGAQEMTNSMITESGRQSHAHGYLQFLPLDSVKFSTQRSTILAVFSAAKQTAFTGPSPTCMSHFSINHWRRLKEHTGSDHCRQSLVLLSTVRKEWRCGFILSPDSIWNLEIQKFVHEVLEIFVFTSYHWATLTMSKTMILGFPSAVTL